PTPPPFPFLEFLTPFSPFFPLPPLQLLIPHMRFTVHIATLARKFLLNPGGVFDSAVALGRRGLLQLVARGLRSLSYSSLVVPRDLRRRGVTRTPGYHYARDALRIWRAIHSYVRGVLGLYYPGDSAVRGDPELQAWVGEIFRKGFLGRRRSGDPHVTPTPRPLPFDPPVTFDPSQASPSSLTSLPEAAIFVTMVIYSCSALHAATNSGQFELGAFIPNMPAAMREPPPETKEPLGEEDFLRALPAMNTSAITLGVLWVLRNEPFDMRALGCYPENHFTEEAPRALIRRFRRRLAAISRSIQRRNQGLALPYPYLDPRNIENSVAI
ncbi:hydroperoxide isomerase ALOXE3-like, partial [Heliangelus exortis]|uniref:hydroperoxide isomerase ALOXE3-like n=1 Tax=Heliangelus exortis TaxID=472823 RepID=UPI003A8FF245